MIRHDLSKPPAYAYLPFRLPKQKEPAIGGLISSVEINCEFLTMDGWQIEGEQSSFGHDGCGGREYAKHLVLTTDLLRESRGSCHSRHAFPHIRCIIQARAQAEALGIRPPQAEPERRLPDKPSIAVLPFTNLSGDPNEDYFSDGITEDIITELSRFSELFVIARNSSFTYKGRTV